MEFLKSIGVGVRPIDDPFFDETYKSCKIFQRKGVIAEDDEDLCHDIIKEFPCPNSQCAEVFKTLLDFEMHYNSCHRYICMECKKIKPNSRLLEIHIQETHDTFFKLLSEKQPMYQCYVSQCNMKFNNPNERREHCINVHKYPKNCRFDMPYIKKENSNNKMDVDSTNKMDIDIVDEKEEEEKKKKKKILLNKNQKMKTFNTNCRISNFENSAATCTVSSSTTVTNIDKNASLMFIPRQVEKSYARTLSKKQNKERNVLEAECMSDLAQSLPD
ncbi:PREDICTED: zinc finger protein 511 [Polistes dominula]|uniref:Zinc finger protein 511 n=1 Tax=Polistes dominula TaxID=743375 RepID=A0ABM1I1I8_POLDO|nr:PREDICTED: zinc finger protein 511 [Polistes dominula]